MSKLIITTRVRSVWKMKKQNKAEGAPAQSAAPMAPKPRKKPKHLVRILIALGVVLALLVLFVVPKLFQKPVYPSVNVAAAAKGDVQTSLDTSGIVKSEEVKTYFSPVNATIQELNVREGDPVSEGDKLVVFDLTDLEDKNKEAELQQAASQYGYQDSVQKSREGSADLNDAKSNLDTLDQQIREKKDEITRIQDAMNADAIEFQQELEDWKKEQQQAPQSTPVPTATPDPADPNATPVPSTPVPTQTPASDMPTYTADAKLQARLESANSELAELQAKKSEYEAQKSSAEASILTGNASAQLKANNELTKLSGLSVEELLEKGREGISADFSGVVTKVSAQQGGPATQGGELFTVSSNKDVVLEIKVSKYDLEKIAVGQKAVITMVGKEYTGEVTRINRMASVNEKGTPVVAAEVKFDNPDEDIYLGVEAKVSIQGDHAENVVLVPSEAINTGTDGTFCYVVVDGKIAKRMVTTGISSDEYIEVKEGINEGDQVITSVTVNMQEGMQVNPVDVNAAAAGTAGAAQADEAGAVQE